MKITMTCYRPLLSMIVPVYNEGRTIAQVLRRVMAARYTKEIMVVDDGSTDDTEKRISDFKLQISEWPMQNSSTVVFQVLRHETNRGKGAAICTGLAAAWGKYVIVQDADLEYDPQDFPRLVEPLVRGEADVVYGSRYLEANGGGGRRYTRWLSPATWKGASFRWGVRLLNALVRVLYGVRLTDEATCYKVFKLEDLRRMDLKCERFEFCPEVTAKACRMGLRILEVPISYHPRSHADGKKIRWRDGIAAVRELWKWRNWRPAENLVPVSLAARCQAPEHEPARGKS